MESYEIMEDGIDSREASENRKRNLSMASMCPLGMIPLSEILKKTKMEYDLGRGKGKVNHFLFMDNLKLFTKSGLLWVIHGHLSVPEAG